MLNVFDSAYISAKIWLHNFVETIRDDESGVSGFVATVLLILFAVLAGGLLWNWLGGDDGYLAKMFKKIEENSDF